MILLDNKNTKINKTSSCFNSNKFLGFSLIEVVVTTAIFAIMMGIAFTNYPRLTQAVAFDTASQNLLDVIKSAQVTGSARGGDYRGDGVYFKLSDPFNFTLFSDFAYITDLITGNKKSDKIYSNNLIPLPGDLDGATSTSKIQNNVKITKLCVKTGVTKDCNKAELSISFTRPFLNANISDNNSKESDGVTYTLFEKGYIELYINGSAGLDNKCILVYKYGQADIKNGLCDAQP